MLRLRPRILALMAVQRQTAASRSTRPLRREQHGNLGGFPMTTFTKPRTSAQTPSLRASLGHLPLDDGDGVGVGLEGVDGVDGVGVGQVPHEVTKAKKRRFTATKRAAEAEDLGPCWSGGGGCRGGEDASNASDGVCLKGLFVGGIYR
ncbi:hypothetical protein QJS10_CPB11g00386 [Acorus calamus]|uniref:Uncharacterized protein n=1 Tax=Acorus calamus TaxID=4465 RepID=A0AAV9DXQ5_ACOCL|nr:hypothetical protein QJS10_CPB11g00386 [Acorus calamus]